MTWIITYTGSRFDLIQPDPASIHPTDIAHALAQQCRFNGHCVSHYSVAQHSYFVADLVPEEHQLAALLHDASEAYIGDMVRPLKELLPEFRQIEAVIWSAICERFDLDEQLPAEVKRADLIALATERRDLMHFHQVEWGCLEGIAPHRARISPWSAADARYHFHRRLLELLAVTHRKGVTA
ncbi:phosphohydrolase [Pseudomonas aeruginosa]|uniref:phosphohydrolase n=1 Tax=Pseudomonas aeruginosa TaxID=287 RepID=UPI001BD53479|nr:phosphohydrolase [Pseudomonas aeruginosa]MBS9728996.1 phosphohydrolase [Pseudomonas aeruginosa]